jgi:endoglucanase
MYLLGVYDAFREEMASANYNLPESGNGLSDVLNEALWGVRLYEELQEADGGVRAGTETSRHPAYGQVNAASDELVYRTYRRDWHTTGCAAGMFAQASRLLNLSGSHHRVRSLELQERAENAWSWMEIYDGEDKRAAQRLYAAVELYELTGSSVYHDAIGVEMEHLRNNPGWPEEYRPWHMNIPNVVGGMFNTPYFFTYLKSRRPTNESIRAKMRDWIRGAAEATVNSVADSVYPHGPLSVVAWGSLTSQGRYAEPVIFEYALSRNQSLIDTVSQLSDYALGLNPLGRSFVTGLGARPPTDPLHLDSYSFMAKGRGPVPGITIYGPVGQPSSKMPAAKLWQAHYPGFLSLPQQHRFVDGWLMVPMAEFTTWETVAPNAMMHVFLDTFQSVYDCPGQTGTSPGNFDDSSSAAGSFHEQTSAIVGLCIGIVSLVLVATLIIWMKRASRKKSKTQPLELGFEPQDYSDIE